MEYNLLARESWEGKWQIESMERIYNNLALQDTSLLTQPWMMKLIHSQIILTVQQHMHKNASMIECNK